MCGVRQTALGGAVWGLGEKAVIASLIIVYERSHTFINRI